MKAIIYHQYGDPGVMELQEVKEPVPADDQVLVRVHAASVNASDYEFLTGSPKYTRMWGLFKPKVHILGSDIADKVVAVGKNVIMTWRWWCKPLPTDILNRASISNSLLTRFLRLLITWVRDLPKEKS